MNDNLKKEIDSKQRSNQQDKKVIYLLGIITGMVFFFFGSYCSIFYCFCLLCPRCVLVPPLVAGPRVPECMLCSAG